MTGLTLFIVLREPVRTPQPPSHETPSVSQSSPNQTPRDNGNGSDQTHVGETTHAYEAPADDFEAKVRNVDLAILQALSAINASESAMRLKAVEARHHNGQEFYYQNLTVMLSGDAFPFLAQFKHNLSQLAPEARLMTVNDNPRDLEISILGEPTHHLFLPLTLAPEPVIQTTASPKLVIIIDDLGESVSTARRLASLPFPVSFSVLPHNTRAREVAKVCRDKNLELLLHLPCEPDGYPKIANSGPGTLRVGMSPAVLEQTLIDNLSRLPEVDGVNNHMGSKLTRDKKAMSIILAHLKGRGKFFLDSLTTTKSCVRQVSSKLGMRYYRRHIFLDNTVKEQAITLQLKKAETLAKRNGVAVAIGHPHPATLAALEAWAETRDTQVILCKVQDI